MKKAIVRLTVLALMATALVLPITGGTASADPAPYPSNCLEYEFEAVAQIECFVGVIATNMSNTPDAELDDLGELRTKVVYLKLQLLRARNSVIQTKFMRADINDPADYAGASVGLAALRAQVQEIRSQLAGARADVQFARLPVSVT